MHKDHIASLEHPIFSLLTQPHKQILNYVYIGTEITVVLSFKDLAKRQYHPNLLYFATYGGAERGA